MTQALRMQMRNDGCEEYMDLYLQALARLTTAGVIPADIPPFIHMCNGCGKWSTLSYETVHVGVEVTLTLSYLCLCDYSPEELEDDDQPTHHFMFELSAGTSRQLEDCTISGTPVGGWYLEGSRPNPHPEPRTKKQREIIAEIDSSFPSRKVRVEEIRMREVLGQFKRTLPYERDDDGTERGRDIDVRTAKDCIERFHAFLGSLRTTTPKTPSA